MAPASRWVKMENLYRAVEGARFTNYTDFYFVSWNAVFSPELGRKLRKQCARYDEKDEHLCGRLYAGGNDELWFTGGERGTNILYCGTTPLRNRNCSLTAA